MKEAVQKLGQGIYYGLIIISLALLAAFIYHATTLAYTSIQNDRQMIVEEVIGLTPQKREINRALIEALFFEEGQDV